MDSLTFCRVGPWAQTGSNAVVSAIPATASAATPAIAGPIVILMSFPHLILRDLKRAGSIVAHFWTVGRPVRGAAVAARSPLSHHPLRCLTGKTRQTTVNSCERK
ncbi:hypothetical protein GCM10007858_07850 [Bradyrhizobium liaoningense]|nr:hypothetical protein GCM10007858_07850 [Bradyrhizobium liaoningense]